MENSVPGDPKNSSIAGSSRRHRQSHSEETNEEMVHFNIGGKLFQLSKNLVQNVPETLLTKLLDNEHNMCVKDKHGVIIIDRDPTFFNYIVAFLENPVTSSLPTTKFVQEKVLVEADFYCVQPMVTELQKLLDKEPDDEVFPVTSGAYVVFRDYETRKDPHFAVFFEKDNEVKLFHFGNGTFEESKGKGRVMAENIEVIFHCGEFNFHYSTGAKKKVGTTTCFRYRGKATYFDSTTAVVQLREFKKFSENEVQNEFTAIAHLVTPAELVRMMSNLKADFEASTVHQQQPPQPCNKTTKIDPKPK